MSEPTEQAVREALARTAATLPYAPDLAEGMHRRADRIRRRRRRVAAAAAAVAVLAGGGLVARLPDPVAAADGDAVAPTATASPGPAVPTAGSTAGSLAPTPNRSAPPPTGTPTPTGTPGSQPPPATPDPWGAPLLDEQFSGTGPDPLRWSRYQGPSASPETYWSSGAVSGGDGLLRLTVRRVSDRTPTIRAGGVRLVGDRFGAGQRYGRWEVRWRMTAAPGVTGQLVFLGAGPGGISQLATLSPAEGSLTLEDLARGSAQEVALAGTAFHTLALESTPERLRWLLDGAVVADRPGGAPTGPLVAAVQALVREADCGATPLPAGCAGAATYPQVLEVDRLRIWAYRR